MMSLLRKYWTIIGLICVILLGVSTTCFVKKARSVDVQQTASMITDTAKLSNKKIKWGLKRGKDNLQPEIGGINQNLLDGYKGLYMGGTEKKYIYLTFDEGYEAGYTDKILDVLKENNVKATFFLTGYYLNKETVLVKRMVDEGHIIGNHTVNHNSMPDLDDVKLKTEIKNLHTAVCEKIGYEMKYIRPPMGEYSERTLAISNALGYTTVMWSFAYEDWDPNKQPNEEEAKNKIMSNIHAGEIMLLHATSSTNANILDYCIKEIRKQGYEFKTLDEFER